LYNIDLLELAARESERVEWKENGSDKDIVHSIVRTLSAFANDISNLGGGFVVCGAQEGKDAYGFPQIRYTGLSASKIQEISNKVLAYCRDYVSPSILPIIEELPNPHDESTRVLVFIMSATADAHTCRHGDTSPTYYVRQGSHTREARNGILTQLLVKKNKVLPFDQRACPNTTTADVDLWSLRDSLEKMGLFDPSKPPEYYLSDTEQFLLFVPPLMLRDALSRQLSLRNAGLLLFGKLNSIYRHFSHAYIIVSIYRGTDRSLINAQRHELTGTIIEQTRQVLSLLNQEAVILFDKANLHRPNTFKYPQRALHEALVNAVVHRDYQLSEPIRVTIFSNRIEIMSPGGLHWGIDKAQFLSGKSGPKWRNQSFAAIFAKLQLAQHEGQGIPTIFDTLRPKNPAPIFDIADDSVTCIIKPSADWYDMTIEQSNNFADAQFLFDDMKAAGLTPDEISYSTLIKKSQSYEQAKAYFEEMKKAGLTPNEISYSTLINKSQSYEQAKAYFEEMKKAGLKIDEISYNTLINKSERFSDAKFFFDEIKQQGLRLDEISYNTLINKTPDFETAKPYYEQFLQKFPLRRGNGRSEKNYNFLFTALFRRIKTREQWQFIQAEIYRLQLSLDNYTQSFYNTLQHKFGA
jgi:pentatricopeptide repeat protein